MCFKFKGTRTGNEDNKRPSTSSQQLSKKQQVRSPGSRKLRTTALTRVSLLATNGVHLLRHCLAKQLISILFCLCNSRSQGEEPIPAVSGWEAGHTLARSQVCHRDNTASIPFWLQQVSFLEIWLNVLNPPKRDDPELQSYTPLSASLLLFSSKGPSENIIYSYSQYHWFRWS